MGEKLFEDFMKTLAKPKKKLTAEQEERESQTVTVGTLKEILRGHFKSVTDVLEREISGLKGRIDTVERALKDKDGKAITFEDIEKDIKDVKQSVVTLETVKTELKANTPREEAIDEEARREVIFTGFDPNLERADLRKKVVTEIKAVISTFKEEEIVAVRYIGKDKKRAKAVLVSNHTRNTIVKAAKAKNKTTIKAGKTIAERKLSQEKYPLYVKANKHNDKTDGKTFARVLFDKDENCFKCLILDATDTRVKFELEKWKKKSQK